jgi:hypothetical protein
MNNNIFVKALLPIWLTEVVLTGLLHAFGPEEVTIVSTALMVVSIVLLPFIAGFRVVRSGGGVGLAILGGVSISVVSILTVGVSYLISSSDFMAFVGYIIATLMFSVIPQVISGSVGGLVARKTYAKAT